jgi:hypothetical protein
VSELFGRSEPKITDLSRHDAARLEESLVPLLEAAKNVSWYDAPGQEADLAMARLCLLRRARAGASASAAAGDEGVRVLLTETDHEAVVWMLSRAVSYMDEQGFPEIVPGAWLELEE